MGSGKSSAAIAYMNAHPQCKFIYITPYIAETQRIAAACPSLDFVEPSGELPEFHGRKSEHIAALVFEGRNITTTHQSFSRLSESTLRRISSQRYTLIIDEAVEMIASLSVSPGDVSDAMRLGYIQKTPTGFSVSDTSDRSGSTLRDVLDAFDHGEVFRYSASTGEVYFWTLPASLITAFDTVFILTYLFEGQALSRYLRLNGVRYDYIGVRRDAEGHYGFSKSRAYVPPWLLRISDYIDVLDHDKLNQIGDRRCALSWHWFHTHSAASDQILRLSANLDNLFRHIYSDSSAGTRLCGTCREGMNKLGGRRFSRSMIAFNARATNEYSHCRYLAYVMNVFFNPNTAQYFADHGLDVDEDVYALSVMLQWIWRSAIRNGEKIHIYIPSRRMRELLMDWMQSVEDGASFSEVHAANMAERRRKRKRATRD